MHSQGGLPETMESNRPKIGLVLSGNGTRGAAHIWVLKVLEGLRIPIDYIAGTSMGAIVSGLYASGMTPAEIIQRYRLPPFLPRMYSLDES